MDPDPYSALSAAQIIAIAISLLLLGASAFISGSEIAFFSLSRRTLDDLDEEQERDRRAARVLRLLSSPDRLLATILIANNLVNVAIVVLLNYALGPVFSGMSAVWSFVLQTVILTFLILLFGEILPKLYATTAGVRWALGASAALAAVQRLCTPLSSLLVRSTGLVNRVVPTRRESLTADDLTQALELADGTTADDKQMLEGILRFGDTDAAAIMTPRVDITDIDITATYDEVLHTVTESGFARIPVYEDTQDNIRGILYARDLLPYIGTEPPADWTTLLRQPYFVPETRMLDDLLEDFRRRRMHMAVVVDEYGGTQGIVTLEDILEEIVGDIDDEYDEEGKTYRRLPDDAYIFEGRTLLNDFFRVTGLDEEEYAAVAEDAETLAGMLLNIKGDFPREKEPLVWGRCRFLVLDIVGHRIQSVRVKVEATPVAP